MLRWTIGMVVLAAALVARAQDSGMKVVYRINTELFTLTPNGSEKQLTHDGVPKGDAAWSKDGTKIAFLRKVDQNIALGDLVVIDPESGRTIANVLICPAKDGIGYFVQEIDDLEWITATTIVVTGALNPSTVQSMVMDIQTGQDVDDVFDDDGPAVFSADGTHVATVTGSPHFTPASEQAPQLDIDGERVFPPKRERAIFLSKAAWAPDSTEVAAAIREKGSKAVEVAICRPKSGCELTAIPNASGTTADDFQLQWSGGRVYVSSQTGHWNLQPDDAIAASSTQPGPVSFSDEDTEAQFESKIEQLGGETALDLVKQVRKRKGLEPDVWCRGCGLAQLPRTVHHQ